MEGLLYITRLIVLNAAVLLVAVSQDAGQAIDTQRSSITVHVGKAGLFAAAAHEHRVEAPIASGMLNAVGAMPGVRFTVDARKLSVAPEKGVNENDQAEIQANMQTRVLESSAHPEITFQSTEVRRNRDNLWRVSGDLMLHGVTRSLTFDVARESGAYVGIAHINQTDFGIQPITIGGGLVKVKNELEITFRVYALSH